MPACAPVCAPCAPCGPCGEWIDSFRNFVSEFKFIYLNLGPASPCGPCGPFYNPLASCAIPECGPCLYTSADLSSMPQCPSVCPPAPCGPRFVTVQQPPKTICKKDIVYVKRSVIDKHVLPCTKTVCEPKLIYKPKTIMTPIVIWKKRTIPCPQVIWYKKVVPDPKVVCATRVINEPKEVCRTLVCQPRPQIIQVPPPKEYCCFPTGANFMKPEPGCGNPAIAPCGPCEPGCGPCGPCAPACGPCPPMCGPCGPFGPCGPCGKFKVNFFDIFTH